MFSFSAEFGGTTDQPWSGGSGGGEDDNGGDEVPNWDIARDLGREGVRYGVSVGVGND